MRIAQIAPLWELVPPRAYGGTELVVHLLTEGLISRGHEVTLFAATGSDASGRLKTYSTRPFRELESLIQWDKTHCTVMATELSMLEDIFTQTDAFDVIHNHIGFQALPFAGFTSTPVVTTLHNALTPEPVYDLFMRNAHLPYVSISNYQRELWPDLNYVETIYHGIDLKRFYPDYSHQAKDYLVFLGRLSPEKGPQHAVHIAKSLGMKLILAGKIDRVDRVFYERELAHWVDGQQICYIGEVGHEEKVDLLRNAAAMLCPIEWPEPFGLVMIEAMACGTPVFALRDGSVPEVIDHGFSGFIADSVDQLKEAVKGWRQFDRRQVRKIAEDRFSVTRMVGEHERLYEKLLSPPHGALSRRGTPASKRVHSALPSGRLLELRQAQPALDGMTENRLGESGHPLGLSANYPAGS